MGGGWASVTNLNKNQGISLAEGKVSLSETTIGGLGWVGLGPGLRKGRILNCNTPEKGI